MAYVRILQSPVNAVAGELFNIVDYSTPTFEELKLAGAKLQGFSGKITYSTEFEKDDFEANFVNSIVVNPNKAIQVLNWNPTHLGLLHEMELYFKSWQASGALNGLTFK
eukprot:TRINITY_DN9676_c0_g1_i1.p1 TRINITY_DN9676_c0_g1~~TRINITY_DN9676_c0_g1_i1.p1  ORF type:complete len:109 (-),score=18.71 TRINITY_DN9676_c0_g1_i1:46-372(-)